MASSAPASTAWCHGFQAGGCAHFHGASPGSRPAFSLAVSTCGPQRGFETKRCSCSWRTSVSGTRRFVPSASRTWRGGPGRSGFRRPKPAGNESCRSLRKQGRPWLTTSCGGGRLWMSLRYSYATVPPKGPWIQAPGSATSSGGTWMSRESTRPPMGLISCGTHWRPGWSTSRFPSRTSRTCWGTPPSTPRRSTRKWMSSGLRPWLCRFPEVADDHLREQPCEPDGRLRPFAAMSWLPIREWSSFPTFLRSVFAGGGSSGATHAGTGPGLCHAKSGQHFAVPGRALSYGESLLRILGCSRPYGPPP